MSDEMKQTPDIDEGAAVDDEAPTTQYQAVSDDAETEQYAAVDGEDEAIDAAVEAATALEAAQKDAAEWKTRAYRATADLDNLRKRFQKEREELRRFAVEGLIKDLLPVVDNMERALAHAEGGEGQGLIDGVKMVLRQFTQKLSSKGAEPFDPTGEPFDPVVHEAMTQMVTADVEPGHVAQTFQRGWKLNGRLVRPAMVIVAKAPEGGEDG